jgi:hypothetical protein
MVASKPTKFPPPWHADGRRRADHGARKRISQWRAYQATWRKPIDQLECNAERFHYLRRHVLMLNRKQTAQLLRVSVSSLLNWESGVHPTPFYAYLSLLLISESQHYRLANEAWRDWEFTEILDASRHGQHKGGFVTYISNRKIGAAFTPEELERYSLQMSRLAALESANAELREQVDALARENTEIRELFRVQGVTDELHGMRERVEALLGRINTAALLPLKKVASGA